MSHILALDFDGVICDSAWETGMSAYRALGMFRNQELGVPSQDFVEKFVRVRPTLETGYQAILLAGYLLDGMSVEDIVAATPGIFAKSLDELKVDRQTLVNLFGRARDEWIGQDAPDWLAQHRFFPGTIAKLKERMSRYPTYILTTKQERFARTLLDSAGVVFSSERIFGLESSRPKEEHLRNLQKEHEGKTIHFVEDRLDTLLRILACPDLADVRLYYADWGYGLPEHLRQAEAEPRISVWSIDQFLQIG